MQSTWDHWIVSDNLIVIDKPSTNDMISIGELKIYVPTLIASDAGTYWCFYNPGANVAGTFGDRSHGLTLNLTTKSKALTTSKAKFTRLQQYMVAFFVGSFKLI